MEELDFVFPCCQFNYEPFEPGAFSVVERFGTFGYKGVVFASVCFAAGTAFSNGFIKSRKKMHPNFETPNETLPTLFNALTWSAHKGKSSNLSNLKYQTLNGVEFVLAKALPHVVFKSLVIELRCLNNILGGVLFVTLSKLTDSQKVTDSKKTLAVEEKKSC